LESFFDAFIVIMESTCFSEERPLVAPPVGGANCLIAVVTFWVFRLGAFLIAPATNDSSDSTLKPI